jgi:hypothetical protein
VKLNLGNVKELEPIAAGTYAATFTDWQLQDSRSVQGEKNVNCQFTITEDGPDQGRKIFRNFVVRDTALWALKRFLIRMGAQEDEINDEDADLEDLLNSVKGADCRVKVTQREYQGRMTNDVQDVLSPDYGAFASA